MKILLMVLLLAASSKAEQPCACGPADVAKLSSACDVQIWKDALNKVVWPDEKQGMTVTAKILDFFQAADADHITTAVCAFGASSNWYLGLLRWARVKGKEIGSWEYRWTCEVEMRPVDERWEKKMAEQARREAGAEKPIIKGEQ